MPGLVTAVRTDEGVLGLGTGAGGLEIVVFGASGGGFEGGLLANTGGGLLDSLNAAAVGGGGAEGRVEGLS